MFYALASSESKAGANRGGPQKAACWAAYGRLSTSASSRVQLRNHMDSTQHKSTPQAGKSVDTVCNGVKPVPKAIYRQQCVLDVAGRCVGTDSPDEFIHEFLHLTASKKRPKRKDNPFEALKDANTWEESKVIEKMVSISPRVVCHNHLPGHTESRYQ